jgi:hypothetical protein
MFQWLRNRIGRRQEPERLPEAQGTPALVCNGTRRGHSQPPVRMVRIQNRRRNKVARASRKRNRV